MAGQMAQSERELRLDMVEIGRRMYRRGYISGTDGNISVRFPEGRLLTTPAGVSKGGLETADLVVTDLDGNVVEGSRRPSSELRVHLAVYSRRSDVGAVVHAHPKAAVAHSLAGVSLTPVITPETALSIGAIAEAAYHLPGSVSLAQAVEAALEQHNAIVMARHGTLTLGDDLWQAYLRLESLEHAAETLVMARALGRVEPLPPSEVERLLQVAARAGVTAARTVASQDPVGDGADTDDDADPEDLVRLIVRRVLERLPG